jgi:hypothetical protein
MKDKARGIRASNIAGAAPEPTKGASSKKKGGANISVASLSKGGPREAAVSEDATEHTHDLVQTAPLRREQGEEPC